MGWGRAVEVPGEGMEGMRGSMGLSIKLLLMGCVKYKDGYVGGASGVLIVVPGKAVLRVVGWDLLPQKAVRLVWWRFC